MTTPIPSGTYLRTSEAIKVLGIAKATLYRRKQEGYFLPGVHFVSTGPTARATLLWNVDEVRKVQALWMGAAAK